MRAGCRCENMVFVTMFFWKSGQNCSIVVEEVVAKPLTGNAMCDTESCHHIYNKNRQTATPHKAVLP